MPPNTQHCIERAAHARQQASEATDDKVKSEYIKIAEMWEHLVTSIQKNGLDTRFKS